MQHKHTDTFMKLNSYMCFISNSAGGCFPEWGEQAVATHIFASRKSVSDDMIGFIRSDMNIKEMTEEEYRLLGFAKWDDNGDWLIPVWLFLLLPNGTPLYCPTRGTHSKKSDDSDDHNRLGCVGYSLA